jgi:hypothetical protein
MKYQSPLSITYIVHILSLILIKQKILYKKSPFTMSPAGAFQGTRTIPVHDHDGGRPIEVNECILITHMVYL